MRISRVVFALCVSLSVISLLCAIVFFAYNGQERRLRLDAEQKLIKSFQLNEAIEQRLADALFEKKVTESRLKEAENRLFELNGKLSIVNRELEEARRDAQNLRLIYQKVLRQKQTLITQLRKRDNHIRRILTEMIEVEVQKETVNLGSVVMSGNITNPRSTNPLARKKPRKKRSLDGTVIAVNEEFDFVVLSLGRKHGIHKGTRIVVYRGKRSLGEAEVEMAHETISAATFSHLAGTPIQIGDRVRILQPS